MKRVSSILLLVALAAICFGPVHAERGKETGLSLILRDRSAEADKGEQPVRFRPQRWDAKKTAIIVCDMWDLHHCKRAVDRVLEMAPRMNEVLTRARDQGVLIIHAPSSCMEPYEKTPMRQRARNAATAKNLPKDIASWCTRIPSEEKGRYPIDQSDGGEDDEATEHAQWAAKLSALGRNPRAPWKSQIDLLKMDEKDAISDSGVEIWNLLEARGIDKVILLGVHTNMCVLGRPFGLRQMARNGKNVVLMRDMTDTMYNPARWPHVNHFRGTDLIVDHIEKFVCPTITSDQLVGGKPFRFKNDVRPRIVLAISEDEYKTNQTLPPFAARVLETQLGLEPIVLHGDPKNPHVIPGLAEELEKADLLFVSMRRRALPAQDLEAVRKFLAAGKPLVGIRTASHAFASRGSGPKGHAEWVKFDPEVLGGNYTGHHGVGAKVDVAIAPKAADHPILAGLREPMRSHGSLYMVSPLASSTKALLIGTIPGKPPEPVAWVNTYGKSRIFYTSMGHIDDFKEPQFPQLLANAVLWALNRTPASSGAGKAEGTPEVPLPPGAIRRLGDARLRHFGGVAKVAFSPDGKTIAATGDAVLRLWDAATGLENPPLPVNAAMVAYSPDGKRMATGGALRTVRVIDLANGKELWKQSEGLRSVPSISFSPNGAIVASGDSDGFVVFSDATTGEEVKRWKAHDGWVSGLAFSKDGKTLATGAQDATAYLWDLPSGKKRAELKGHEVWVWGLAFSHDGKTVATASWDFNVRLFHAGTGELKHRFVGHKGRARCVAFSPDDKLLASGGEDDTMRLWDVATGKELLQHRHAGWVNSVDFSYDGKTLATGSEDQTIRLWAMPGGEELRARRGHYGIVRSLAFYGDDKLLTGGNDACLSLWSWKEGRYLRDFAPKQSSKAAIVVSPRNNAVIFGEESGEVISWIETETGLAWGHFHMHSDSVTALATSSKGHLASGGRDGKVFLVGPSIGKGRALTQEGWIQGLAFAPDAKTLATGGNDRIIRIWDFVSGEVLRSWKAHNNWISSLAFSPHGKTLASAGLDDVIHLWDPSTGTEQQKLTGHAGSVYSIAYSPDGKMLASGGKDMMVRLWDAKTGKMLKKLEGHRGSVLTVAFSPDGKALASGSADATVLIWKIEQEK